MDAELQRCGVCQRMKSDGAFSDDGTAFICDECNENAIKFLEIQDSLYPLSKAPLEPEFVDDVTSSPRRICAGHVLEPVIGDSLAG